MRTSSQPKMRIWLSNGLYHCISPTSSGSCLEFRNDNSRSGYQSGGEFEQVLIDGPQVSGGVRLHPHLDESHNVSGGEQPDQVYKDGRTEVCMVWIGEGTEALNTIHPI